MFMFFENEVTLDNLSFAIDTHLLAIVWRN